MLVASTEELVEYLTKLSDSSLARASASRAVFARVVI